jgi:hypothetical protein
MKAGKFVKAFSIVASSAFETDLLCLTYSNKAFNVGYPSLIS